MKKVKTEKPVCNLIGKSVVYPVYYLNSNATGCRILYADRVSNDQIELSLDSFQPSKNGQIEFCLPGSRCIVACKYEAVFSQGKTLLNLVTV